MQYYNSSIKEVCTELHCSEKGLTSEEADSRYNEFGSNEIMQQKRVSPFGMFLSQFKDLLIIILIFASFVSLGVGCYDNYQIAHSTDPVIQEILKLKALGLSNEAIKGELYSEGYYGVDIKLEKVNENRLIDGLVILLIVLLNAIVGFFQEFKAEKSLEALRKLVHPRAKVIRDGSVIEIETKFVVPGDILILEEGDRVQADCRVIEAVELTADEAMLTGESTPQRKIIEKMIKGGLSPADQDNMVFMGTVITHGHGKGVVVRTGMNTVFGKIAHLTLSVKEDNSPLQKELNGIGKFASKATLVICVFVLLWQIISGLTILEAFIYSVAIAVAIVPEGLPTTVTIALAMGVQRMAKKKAIVRRLSAVETLGCTTVICSDKTGTLTKNEMTVSELFVNSQVISVSGSGYEPKGEFLIHGRPLVKKEDLHELFQASVLCNDSSLISPIKEGVDWSILGDPTEGALVVAAEKIGFKVSNIRKQYPRINEIPFDSKRKMMTTVNKFPDDHQLVFVKGAPDIVLNLCSFQKINGKLIRLNDKKREEILEHNIDMASRALRVLAVAYKDNRESGSTKGLEEDLVFLGLVGMNDPPRSDVPKAVLDCKESGINIIVITGDYGVTAKAIAVQLGIVDKTCVVVEGKNLDSYSDDKLKAVLNEQVIFARVSPEHKLRVVRTLRSMGHVVAVTGDGVNDAPALKEADIGVSMGIIGTDVSKEASDMVLMDDSFATIVEAIKEGRGIYDGIKKFTRYVFSSIFGEVLVVLFGFFFHLPLPLLATQILWIDLGTEVFPATVLGIDSYSSGDVMKRRPRKKDERIITFFRFIRWLSVALLMAILVIGLFIYVLKTGGWHWGDDVGFSSDIYLKALTMSFTLFVFLQMINVFNCRSEKDSLFKVGIFSNKLLIFAVLFSVIMQIIIVSVPFFQTAFHTIALSVYEWGIIVGLSMLVFIYDEVYKLVLRSKASSN